MKLKADFHIHTHYSVDSSLPPTELVKKARAAGISVIGVADHNTCRGAIDAKKAARGNPLVLIGQEVKTMEGDLLVFGPERDLKPGRPVKETCIEARGLGGFVVVPHPFDIFRDGIGKHMEEILDHVDAIEGFNSMCIMEKFNVEAREFARDHGKPVVAGSDAHFGSDVGSAYTILDCDRDEASVLAAVRSGRTELFGTKKGIKKRILSKIAGSLKKQ